MKIFLSWLFLVGWAVFAPALGDSPEGNTKATAEDAIERLIEQLGDKEYRIRDQATRKLKEMDEALPVLLRAKPSMDLETSQRADMIIGTLRQRAVRALVAKGKQMEIDLFIDHLFTHTESLDDNCWRAALELAQEMVHWAQKKGGRAIRLSDHDFVKCPAIIAQTLELDLETPRELNAVEKRVFTRRIVAHWEVSLVEKSLVFCHEKLRANCVDSIVFVNGNIEPHPCRVSPTREGVAILSRCVIFCDGHIRLDKATECLLVATGKIRIKSPGPENIIVEDAKNPLSFLKLYDTSAVGIEVRSADKGVVVEKVHEGKRFAKAGIIKGDVLLTVRATKDAPAVEISSPETFRRQVRRLVVHNGQGILQIERGGKVLELVVPF